MLRQKTKKQKIDQKLFFLFFISFVKSWITQFVVNVRAVIGLPIPRIVTTNGQSFRSFALASDCYSELFPTIVPHCVRFYWKFAVCLWRIFQIRCILCCKPFLWQSNRCNRPIWMCLAQDWNEQINKKMGFIFLLNVCVHFDNINLVYFL